MLHLGVDLPTAFADVRDAEHRARHSVDQYVTDGAVGEAGLTEVVSLVLAGDDLGHRGLSLRTPHAERACCRGLVAERDRTVGRHVAGEPVLVAPAVERSRDNPEVVLTESHDREVGPEASVGCKQRCVDRATDRDIARVDRHVIEEHQGAWTLKVELVERREVDHADMVTHVEVFGVGDR